MIADELVAIFERGEATSSTGWTAFSIAVLRLALDLGWLDVFSGRIVTDALHSLEIGDMTDQKLASARKEIWGYMKARNGNAHVITGDLDRAMRIALFALESPGDRVKATEAAGWVEDLANRDGMKERVAAPA